MKNTDEFRKALEHKKLPLLVLDQKWHRLFAIHGKTDEIRNAETELNNLLARQGKLNSDLKDYKKVKNQLMDEIVQNMEGSDGNASDKEKVRDKDKRMIDELNERIDAAEAELLELPQEARRDPFPKPWERFRQELEARLDPIDPRHQIDLLKLETYESDEEIKPVFVSRMPNHKVTGAAHAETIRSSKGGDGFTVTKTPLTNLKLNKFGEIEGYYNPASDTLLYDALLARLKDFGGDGAKAFAQPFYKPKKDGSPGPRVDKVKICEKATVGLPVRDGIAANGSMVRIDVFYVEGDGYYFVPIYVADTKKESLPNKAAVAMKPYNLWKKMKDENFVFSLYPGDLVRIQSRKGIKLNLAKGGTGEKEIVRQEGMYYYRSAGIAVAQISVETHDRRYLQPSLGIKTLQSIEKYQVDVLGNYYKVDLPEKRMTFSKEG